MSEDNLTRQVDEVEAVSAIYGDEWCVIDEADRTYCITVTAASASDATWKVILQVLLPEAYPSTASPEYQLNAPWLKDEDRVLMDSKLEAVCRENLGECVLLNLVECIREILAEKAEQEAPGPEAGSTLENWSATLSQEIVIVQSTPEEIEIPDILHGEPFTDRRSTFQGHIASPIVSIQQVKQVVRKLYENRKIANATHNIMAYRIYNEATGGYLQDFDDDGETGAGTRVLHLLQMVEAKNVVVIVSRWFGGILLHQDRFKHISNAARNMLEIAGFIESKESNSKKKKGKSEKSK